MSNSVCEVSSFATPGSYVDEELLPPQPAKDTVMPATNIPETIFFPNFFLIILLFSFHFTSKKS
jgi:hypothetical protein